MNRLLLLAFVASIPAPRQERPNILLVLTDDHSAPYLGCYGTPGLRTPNLDRLAAEGIRFNRAYSTSPQCTPARASLMTGRSPLSLQMTRFSSPLPAEIPAWPDLLRKEGYFTGICRRNFHLDGPGPKGDPIGPTLERLGLKTFHDRVDFLHRDGTRLDTARVVGDFFSRRPDDKPFFLWVNFNDPHRPLSTIPQPHDPASLELPPHFPDLPSVRGDLAHYFDEIARADEEFGFVLQELEKRKLAENTIVIFMGDNGGDLLRGKGSLYEAGCHVPLIVRWPGVVKPGRVSEELISGEDLAPTFLEASDVPFRSKMTGVSFLGHLRGEPFEGRKAVFAERGAHGHGLPTTTAALDLSRSVTTRTHRFIYNALWQLPYWPLELANTRAWRDMQAKHKSGTLGDLFSRLYFAPTRPMFELYDLRSDPHELNNLIGKPEAAATEKELRDALVDWMILERDFLPLPLEVR